MDEFEKAECEGRKIIEQLISGHCINYEFTKDKYCGVDLLVTGYSATVAMEIKNRTGYTSTEIDEMGGHIFEWKKYEALKDYGKYYEKPIYTIIYPDEILMWDISTITDDRFQLEDKKYKMVTVVESEIIPKKVAYLKKDEAIWKKKRNEDEQDS